MLKIPVDCYSILDVLKLSHYQDVLQLLGYRERHIVCMYIANSILDKETIIPTEEDVSRTSRCLWKISLSQHISDKKFAHITVDIIA